MVPTEDLSAEPVLSTGQKAEVCEEKVRKINKDIIHPMGNVQLGLGVSTSSERS